MYQTLARTHSVSKVQCLIDNYSVNVLVSLVLQLQTNHNCAAPRKLTTYCCIASKPTVTACCPPILALFARISKPLQWLNIRFTGAEVAGGQKTFLAMDAALCRPTCHSLRATSTQGSEFGVRGVVTYSRYSITTDRRFICSTVSSPKTKTETKTLRFQDQDQDSEVQDRDQDL